MRAPRSTTGRDAAQKHGHQLAQGLRAREAELCQAILDRVRRLAPDPDRDQDPARVEAMRSTIQAAVSSWLVRVAEGDSAAVGLPSGSWENVRLAARHGLSLGATLQSYVTGHLVSWEFIVDEVEALGLDDCDRSILLKRVSLLETTYFNELIALVSEAYLRERERITRTRSQRLTETVREVLEGGEASSLDLEYRLDGHHVGLVVAGTAPDDVVKTLAAELDRQLLNVSRSERALWAWLGGSSPLDPRLLSRSLVRASAEGTMVAAGEQAEGVHGFRLSHHQALAAFVVAQRSGRSLTRYADVALVSWAIRDEHLGPAFVERFLHPLDADERRGSALRATLRAYFASGHNAASAAAALGVHERTVTYRVRAVEELLGAPLHSCRAELEVALRLEELLTRSAVEARVGPAPSDAGPLRSAR